MIYFDAAATSFLKPPQVIEAVCYAMQTMGSIGRGAHEISLRASRTAYRCREQLANLFGFSYPNRVCFTQNATQALNTAIFGLLQTGSHVITTQAEHNSVLRPIYQLESQGVAHTVIPVDDKGRISYDAMEQAIRSNTRAIVCSHASNVTGNCLDISKVGAICRQYGLLFILDGAQSGGILPIDMEKEGISVLCFTGHKGLFGPQGTGGLCVMPEVEIQPLMVGGSGIHSFSHNHPQEYPERLEAGTLNTAGIAGLSAGLDFIQTQGLETIAAYENALAHQFYQGVYQIPNVVVYGDWQAQVRTPVVSINLKGEDAGVVSDILAQEFGMCTRAGAHCAPLIHKALGVSGTVRFSFSFLNTKEEVQLGIEAVQALAEQARSMSC